MGDRPAGPVHLRRVGERRPAALADRRVGARARTRDEYLGHVERWFALLLPEVVPRQHDRGGPVIMVQVENEYGSYGSDQLYLRHLADLLRGGA